MKVIGLGAPDRVRIRFTACEVDLLLDVLRRQRARATLDAAESYGRVTRDDRRSVDDRHERLRALEGMLMQLEAEPPDDRGRVVLEHETEVISDVLRDGAREALQRLENALERYLESRRRGGDGLLNAARTAQAWTVTLARFDHVDLGSDA